MKKLNLISCFFTFIAAVTFIGCEQKCEDKLLYDHPIFLDLVDSLAFGNVQISECTDYIPRGLRNNIILGETTPYQSGHSDNIEITLSSLQLYGLKFKDIERNSFDHYYYFEFKNSSDKKKFVDFKPYSFIHLRRNYQRTKYFILKDEIFLRLRVIP